MIKAVRIYVEGGGEGKNSKLYFRQALGTFLNEIRSIARIKQIRWDVIACGSRQSAYDDFRHDDSLDDPETAVMLLVDSEGPVGDGHTAGQHLQITDKWRLKRQHGDRCHLMVQMMEAWFLADVEQLADYYGAEFNRNPIPARDNVEEISKQEVLSALKKATRKTQKKSYSKGQHSHEILKRIRPSEVRKRAPHCERLFKALAAFIKEQ
jgi:hypothetical protein